MTLPYSHSLQWNEEIILDLTSVETIVVPSVGHIIPNLKRLATLY